MQRYLNSYLAQFSALSGRALLKGTDAVMTPNAAVEYVVLKGLAQPSSSQQSNVTNVALEKVKIVATRSLETIRIVNTSRVTVNKIVEVTGNSFNQLKLYNVL